MAERLPGRRLAGVFAQRFKFFSALDIDGNGIVDPLTDGLLNLRFLFGFTGTTLTNGAVGANCTRCTAAAILSYLAGLGLGLDVDQNTDLDPLTDGVLVLRFLFGFTGNALVQGAVGTGCGNCDAAEIEGQLNGMI